MFEDTFEHQKEMDKSKLRERAKQQDGTEFNPHDALRRVSEHIDSILEDYHRVRKDAQLEISELKSENRQLLQKTVKVQQEVDRLAESKAEIEYKIEMFESKLMTEKTQVTELRRQNATLETELGWAQEKVEMLDERLQEMTDRAVKAQHEVERLEMHNTSLSSKLENTDTKLEDERSQTAKLKTQVKKLQAELKSAQDKNEFLHTRIDDATKRIEEEKRKFSARVTHDANHDLLVLKKRIAAALKSDLRDLEKIESLPMTEKIGDNLRNQLAALFGKLRDLGIELYD